MKSYLTHNLKRVVAGVLALLLVAGAVPSNAVTERLFGRNGTSITAFAATETLNTVSQISWDSVKDSTGDDDFFSKLTGFEGVSENDAKKWNGAPKSGYAILVYGKSSDGRVMYCIFNNGSVFQYNPIRKYHFNTGQDVAGTNFKIQVNAFGVDRIYYTCGYATVAVDSVELSPTTEQTIDVDGVISITATVSPENATNQKVIWELSNDPSAVALYSDIDCTTPVTLGTETDLLTVYVKGVAQGSEKIDVFSASNTSKFASCFVTVNPAHTHSFTYNASGATITAHCNVDGCGLTSDPTLTIVPPTMTVSGGTGSAAATLNGLADFNSATGNSVAATAIKYVGRDGTNYAESTTAPTAPGKYTAKITVGEKTATVDYSIKATVTFETYGGTPVPEQQLIEAGESATIPETDPAKEGNYFGGWYADDEFSTKYNFNAPITQNTTVYAKFGENKATWMFVLPNNSYLFMEVFTGTAPAPDSGKAAAVKSALTDQLNGGTFTDWTTATDASGNVTYTTNVSYTVTLHANEGTVNEGNIETYVYGKGATLPTNVTKEGSEFDGWYDNADLTGTAVTQITATDSGNKEYWAKWKQPISQTVTFKVVNGSWDDETTADKTVTLNGYEGDTLKLSADQIPAAGTKPNEDYLPGSWNVTPSTDTEITEATTYTYTYAKKNAAAVATAPAAKNPTYNKEEQELVTAGTAEGGTLVYAIGSATETLEPYTPNIPIATNAGTYYVWYKVIGDETHLDSEPACVTASIDKAALTVTATPANKTYGEADPSFGYDVTGLVEGDTLTGELTREPGNNVGTHAIRQGTLAASDNYTIEFTGADFTISKAAITISAVDNTSKYGEDIKDLTYQIFGDYVEGDDLGVELNTTATKDSDTGEYPITVSWNENGNYEATLEDGTYTITKTDLTVTAMGWSGTYDKQPHGITVDIGTSDATVYYSDTELTADNYETAGSKTPLEYTDAGEYTVYYYVVSNNYKPDQVSGSKTVSIAKADPEVTAPTAKQLVYNDEGKAQELVNAGTTTGGTLVYAIGSAKEPLETYTPYLPTATQDGTYYVWYKVEGDDNYNGTEPQSIEVTIERSTKQLTDEAKAKKVKLTDVYSDSYGTLTAKWQNDGYADGYEVLLWNSRSMGYRTTVSRFTVDGTESDITIDGLIPGARYFVKVRGYKNIDGKRVYGKFSSTGSATVKRYYYGFGSGFGFGYGNGYGYGFNPYYNNPWNFGYSMNPFTRSNPWGYGYNYGRPYLAANSYRPMMSPYYFFRF